MYTFVLIDEFPTGVIWIVARMSREDKVLKFFFVISSTVSFSYYYFFVCMGKRVEKFPSPNYKINEKKKKKKI